MLLGCTLENTITELDEPEPIDVEGCLRVEPEDLWFGTVQVGRSEARPRALTLSNDCDGEVVLEELRLSDPDVYSLSELDSPWLPGGDSVEVEVSFDPGTHHVGPDSLRILSSAGDHTVALHADGSAPVLEVADWLELPLGRAGCPQSAELVLSNQGSDTLVISDLLLEATSEDLHLDAPELPFRLIPGAETALGIDHLPLDTVTEAGRLVISSNDPARPEAQVGITATS